LQNAKAVWGEQSLQYAASKRIAESHLDGNARVLKDVNHDTIVAHLEALALNSWKATDTSHNVEISS